jgi:hypothetical protein
MQTLLADNPAPTAEQPAAPVAEQPAAEQPAAQPAAPAENNGSSLIDQSKDTVRSVTDEGVDKVK